MPPRNPLKLSFKTFSAIWFDFHYLPVQKNMGIMRVATREMVAGFHITLSPVTADTVGSDTDFSMSPEANLSLLDQIFPTWANALAAQKPLLLAALHIVPLVVENLQRRETEHMMQAVFISSSNAIVWFSSCPECDIPGTAVDPFPGALHLQVVGS